MAEKGRGIFMVYVDIDAPQVQEFNEWYNKEHLPELLSVPGILSAARYEAVSRRSQVVRLRGAFAPFRPTPRAHRKVSREVGEGTLGLCQHTEATALVLKGPLSRRLSKPARAVAKEGFEQNNAPNSMVILVIIFLTI